MGKSKLVSIVLHFPLLSAQQGQGEVLLLDWKLLKAYKFRKCCR